MTAPTDPTDNSDLDDYLAGDSELSRRYRSLQQPEPSRALDRAVLAEAGAVPAPVTVTPFRSRRPRWMVSFAAAATVLLSFAIFRDAGIHSSAPLQIPAAATVEQTTVRSAKMDHQGDPSVAPLPPPPALEVPLSSPPPVVSALPAPAIPVAPEVAKKVRQAEEMATEDARVSETNKLESAAGAQAQREFANVSARSTLYLTTPPPSPVADTVRKEAHERLRTHDLDTSTPQAQALAAIRGELDAGNTDRARESFKVFLRDNPGYFRQHPEAAKTFPEFEDLLKEQADIDAMSGNNKP